MDTNTGDDSTPEQQLRLALRTALKSKDTIAVSALRSVLAAIANAEAVPERDRPAAASQHVAGGTTGLGSAEAARRTLSREETARIVQDEIADRQAAARQYETAGHPERAERLRHEAQVIRSARQA